MKKRVSSRVGELIAIKARREGRRLSQRQVAKEAGIPKTTLDSYARNEVIRFDESTILALCEYFQVPVGELLVIEDVLASSDEDEAERLLA